MVTVTKAMSALWVERINTAAQESITSTYQMQRASSMPPCPPLPTSHFRTLNKTLARDLPCGDGTATKQSTTGAPPPPESLKPPALPTEVLEKSGSVNPPVLLDSPGDLDHIRLTYTVTTANAREVETLGGDA